GDEENGRVVAELQVAAIGVVDGEESVDGVFAREQRAPFRLGNQGAGDNRARPAFFNVGAPLLHAHDAPGRAVRDRAGDDDAGAGDHTAVVDDLHVTPALADACDRQRVGTWTTNHLRVAAGGIVELHVAAGGIRGIER